MKCLVVEDDAGCVRFIRAALEGLCSQLLDTGYLKTALLLAHQDLDAVWLDLALFDARPLDVIASIPQFRAQCPKATLLVVSGLEHYRENAMAAGADAFETKPGLRGFHPIAVARLLSKAATKAMECRGVDSSRILAKVAEFFHTIGVDSVPPTLT